MRTIAVFCLLSASFFVPNQTKAAPPERVKASVDCGSFQVNSVTDQIKVAGQFTRAIFQVIRIINRSRHIDAHLDLKQHFSQDGELDGMRDIDGVANKWWCIRAPSGADFIFIDFVCTEEDAKSCSTAMGAPSGDWRQIYDSGGKALFRNPPDAPEAEDELMKTLGIFDAFNAPIDFRLSTPIYTLSSPIDPRHLDGEETRP